MGPAMLTGKCPVCQTEQVSSVVRVRNVPAHCSLQWSTRELAQAAPRGDIDLAICECCGHLFNRSFDPDRLEYDQQYENSLHFSGRFQEYARGLAERLVKDYDLYGKDIVEIGSGKGDFLKMICQLGGNRGVGFDPSYVPSPEDAHDENVRFVLDFYGERYADVPADLVICRHVLEHVPEPAQLIAMVRQAIGDRKTAIFFEVPSASYMLRAGAVWDLIYEHYSYFTPSSLRYLMASQGFDVVRVAEVYERQYLTIDAIPTAGGGEWARWEDLGTLPVAAKVFGETLRTKVETWASRFEQLARRGQKVVVWGAGSKGVTFLNLLNGRTAIEYVVDINPRKQGAYIAGTGQQIVSPEFLCDYHPNQVILMNPIYRDEVGGHLARLGVAADLVYV